MFLISCGEHKNDQLKHDDINITMMIGVINEPDTRDFFYRQVNRAVARKPRDATAVLFGLKFADIIHYKFKSSQASKARLQSSKNTCTCSKQNLTQNGH